MVYSRWIHSTWYTFWAAPEISRTFKFPTKYLKGSQIFQIYDSPSFEMSYSDISEFGIDAILPIIGKFYSSSHDFSKIEWDQETGTQVYKSKNYSAKNPSADEMEELRKYIESFVNDVDTHFKWKNFFKYNWIYPLKNKIKMTILSIKNR